jgi:hypothetical protein
MNVLTYKSNELTGLAAQMPANGWFVGMTHQVGDLCRISGRFSPEPREAGR